MGTVGPVFVVVWTNHTTLEGVAASRDGLGQLAVHNPALGFLNIVDIKAPPPSAKVRSAMAAVLDDFAEHLSASAVVVEGEGIRAALVRSVVIGLTMLAKQPFPHQAFATSSAACKWLSEHLAVEDPQFVDELYQGVCALRGSPVEDR